jgi:hypothetical protein
MNSTLCQSAALDRIIAPLAAKIAMFFAVIAEIVGMLALTTALPMPKIMGRPARPLRDKAGFLPVLASTCLLVRAGAQSLANLVPQCCWAGAGKKARSNGDDGEGKPVKVEGSLLPRRGS